MDRIARMRNRESLVAVAVLVVFLHANSWADTDDLAPTFALPQGKGLHGFVEAINARTNALPPAAILSSKSCESIQDTEERQRAQKRRDLGLSLLKELASPKYDASNVRLSAVDDILTVRSWALKKPAYGNLILNYVAEDSAVTLLLRLLAEPKSDVEEIRLRVATCLRDSPSSTYWLSVLDQEKDPVLVETKQGDGSADYLKLASLIEALTKAKAAELGGGEFSFGFGGDYDNCYSKYNPAQVGWLLAKLAMRKSALEACLVMREKLGHMPLDEKDFTAAVKKTASPIMKKQDRIGGRIDSGSVWDVWREALGK